MAQTTTGQVIIPEVWADLAQAKFTGAVRVLTSGAVIYDDNLEGAPGDTIHFPKWGALGELDDLTETVAMTPEAMSTTDSTAVIKEAGKAVEITDKARLTSLGNPEDEARRQFGELAARKVDADLIAVAVAAGSRTVAPTAGTKISWSVVVDAIATFGDEWDPADFAGLYIRAEQMADLFKDTNFVDASKLGTATPVTRGTIGIVGGLPVFVTNRLAANKFAIMKRNVLGALYKRRPIVEVDRDILARSTVITTNVHYAVKRLDDNGVVVGTLS